MNYYILKLEDHIHFTPNVINWYNKFDVRHICREKAQLLPKRTLLDIRSNFEVLFTDIVSFPYLLLSEAAKEVIDVYEPSMQYKDIVLLDREKPKYALYYLPVLETVDCLSQERTTFNTMGAAILQMVLERNKIGNQSIFKLEYGTESYVIARLDLCESLLRRDLIGIGLKKVECV